METKRVAMATKKGSLVVQFGILKLEPRALGHSVGLGKGIDYGY